MKTNILKKDELCEIINDMNKKKEIIKNTQKTKSKQKTNSVKNTHKRRTSWILHERTYGWRATGRSIDDNTNMNVRICLKNVEII